jgi:hypothetical protein
MATAVLAYAVPANVKTRMTQNGINFGNGDDAVLQQLCNQVNGWIEAKSRRILGPIPAFSTTLNGAIGVGATAITLTTVAGLALGDALMLGPVAGTHEHVIVAAIAGSVVTPQAPTVSAYGNGAAAQRCYLFDGADALERGHLIPAPNGVIAMTSLEVGFYTGGAFNLIPPTDWFLRPLPLDREPGWPATEIWMTDVPSSNNPAPSFYATSFGYGGFATARTVMSPGWPAMPDEIVGLSERLVVSAYRARASGGGGQVTVGSDGSRTIERAMDAQDWRLINGYQSKEVVII